MNDIDDAAFDEMERQLLPLALAELAYMRLQPAPVPPGEDTPQ